MRKIATSLLKHHCYCILAFMRTTKTAVCLQRKAIFYRPYWFKMVFRLNFMSDTLPIALTRLLVYNSTINSVLKILTHMTTMLRVVSLQTSCVI